MYFFNGLNPRPSSTVHRMKYADICSPNNGIDIQEFVQCEIKYMFQLNDLENINASILFKWGK